MKKKKKNLLKRAFRVFRTQFIRVERKLRELSVTRPAGPTRAEPCAIIVGVVKCSRNKRTVQIEIIFRFFRRRRLPFNIIPFLTCTQKTKKKKKIAKKEKTAKKEKNSQKKKKKNHILKLFERDRWIHNI